MVGEILLLVEGVAFIAEGLRSPRQLLTTLPQLEFNVSIGELPLIDQILTCLQCSFPFTKLHFALSASRHFLIFAKFFFQGVDSIEVSFLPGLLAGGGAMSIFVAIETLTLEELIAFLVSPLAVSVLRLPQR